MAEAALTSIAKSSLQLFSSLAKDEFFLLWNSQEELQSLQSTIDTISSFLQDAEERKSKERSVQECLSRLTNLMYDADDLFDTLAAQALRKRTTVGNAFTKEVRVFFSKFNHLGFMYKASHQVQSLRKSLDHIRADMEGFSFVKQLPPVDQSIMRANRNKTHSFVHEEDVIGRNSERDEIIRKLLLVEETSHVQTLSAVALIGIGGLGKTTLAQFVYNDKRVEEGFEVRLWACINYLSNLEQALIEIIASKEGKHNDLGLVKLQEKLREIIGGRKFLIIVDDLWDENSENWHSLETILRCGKSGSKVLVTTRSKRVAECVDAVEPYFELGLLSEESAWSLFVKKAFDSEVEFNKHRELEPIGKEIVHICGKVPLAIITIAGVLRHKRREERIWSEFLNKNLKLVMFSDNKARSGCIKDVLMVSYNDLPLNLKLCFASCSLFPKDHVFDKDVVVRLWLSQGFVRPFVGNQQNLEELGEDCFFQLVERCFFQEVKVCERYNYNAYWGDYDPDRILAKMHDLLHDMAIDVAKSEIICIDKIPVSKEKLDILRHVSIYYEMGDSFNPFTDLVSNPKTVRTLLLNPFQDNLSKTSVNQLFKSFKMLRTLCLPHLRVDYLSDSIGELIHLRYLDLSYNHNLKALPSSICKLHHLMFFALKGCKLLEKFPPKIEQLVSLRQLFIEGCVRLDSLPSGIRHLTSLVNLDRFVVHRQSGGLRYLSALHNLSGNLTIELPGEGWSGAIDDAKRSDLSKKLKLNGMNIRWKKDYTRDEQKITKDEAKAVLEALSPHPSLEYLQISNYGGDTLSSWVCMLKHIKELYLYECNVEYLEDKVPKVDLCFPCLKILQLREMKTLKGWRRQEIPQETQRLYLPIVSRVTISGCPELKGGMPLIEELEYLTLDRVDVKLVVELLTVNREKSSKLKELYIFDIVGLDSIPEGLISHLTSLEKIYFSICEDVGWVSRRGLAHLTALRELRLKFLKIEDEDDNKAEMEVGMPWKALNGLVQLQIQFADKHFLEGHQHLTSLQTLEIDEWTIAHKDDGELQKIEFPLIPLQYLNDITFRNFDEKTSLLFNPVPQYLPSVRRLRIYNCKKSPVTWKSLLLMKLDELHLCDVASMATFKEDEEVFEQPNSLQKLYIDDGEKWVLDIPWKFLASLKVLRLNKCGELEHIPEGIQHLTSLQGLYLYEYKKVISLPKWFSQLTFLTSLKILGCSKELERRCQEQTGADWPLICHINEREITTTRRFVFEVHEEEEEDNDRGECCLQGWKISMKGNKNKARESNIRESHAHTSLNQIPQVTNEPISDPKPDYFEMIDKPVSPSNLEPVAKPSPVSLLPTSEVVHAPQPSYDVREGRESFVPLEFVSGFDTGDIHFSNEDVSELVNRWNLSLVGAPMGSNISYQAMQQFISTHWIQGRNIRSLKIQQHDNGLFVFRFDKEEDLLSILQRGPWMISDQTPLILRRWQTGMPLEMSCFEQIPVWVTLPNLDVRFWSHHMLSRIASAVGIPILTDYDSEANQERISFPRLLVQVSAKRPLLDQVRFLGVDGEIVHQRLQYEWFPPQCSKCRVFGHHCIDSIPEIQQASPWYICLWVNFFFFPPPPLLLLLWSL